MGFVGWFGIWFQVGIDLGVSVSWFYVAVRRSEAVLSVSILIEILVGCTVITDELVTVTVAC